MEYLKTLVTNVVKVDATPYLSKEVSIVVSILGGIFGSLFGKFEGPLYAFIVLIVIDYLSGVIVAYNNNEFNRETGIKGITKKGQMLLMVIAANIIDTQFLSETPIARNALLTMYIVNEFISITENSNKLGLAVPKSVMDLLLKMKTEEYKVTDEESEENKNGEQ